ncbi:MAG: sigma-70 family RNA polymerase sigma factor [Cyclobacteriaceae bacterium]
MEKSLYTSDLKKVAPPHLDDSRHFLEKDENIVWQQFLGGDDQCLAYIYQKYVNVLYLYGQQFSKRYEFVQDCIQELFCELIDKRKSLSATKSLKAYLLVSLKRKILRGIKKDKQLQLDEDRFKFISSDPPRSIHLHLKENDYATIFAKINELPSSQREVIFLYFYEGMGYADIAEIMNIKTATARTLTYRALENLEQKLGPHISSFYCLLLLLP